MSTLGPRGFRKCRLFEDFFSECFVCELVKGFGSDGHLSKKLNSCDFVDPVGSHEFSGPLFGPVNSCELRSKISSEFIRVHMNSPKKRKKRAR